MLRRTGPLLAASVCLLIWPGVLSAQAPITRRLEVRQQADGFVVVGFRAEVGRENRFRMTTGMKPADIREQVHSVRWAMLNDRLDDLIGELTASRERLAGAREEIVVRVSGKNGPAYSVAYTVSPARFSRFGLTRFLRSAFGTGSVQVDRPEQLRVTYEAAESPVTLTVQADQVAGEAGQWVLSYTIFDPTLSPEAASPPAGPTGPAGPKELIRVYPPPATQPAEEPESPPVTTTAPAPRGWKTVYPPKPEQNKDQR